MALAASCGGDAASVGDTILPPTPITRADGGADDAPATDLDGKASDVSLDGASHDALAPWGCMTEVTAGHHDLACGGLAYDVEIPAPCAAGGCGVVLDVHGLTMSGDKEERSTKLRTLAMGANASAASSYVVVQPTAAAGVLGPSWNPGSDDDKVWAMLDDVRRALRIDVHRIHVTGFSQGGAMTWRMVCKHADVIASAAPIAAADGKNLDGNTPPFRLDCPFDKAVAPSRPLPILQMHGTKDGLVPFAKAKLQRDAALAWIGSVTETQVASGASFTHTRFTSTTKNVVFEFLEHDYVVEAPLVVLPLHVAGHCFPGGGDLRGASTRAGLFFSCAPPNAFVWGEVVMAFFAANPKP